MFENYGGIPLVSPSYAVWVVGGDDRKVIARAILERGSPSRCDFRLGLVRAVGSIGGDLGPGARVELGFRRVALEASVVLGDVLGPQDFQLERSGSFTHKLGFNPFDAPVGSVRIKNKMETQLSVRMKG